MQICLKWDKGHSRFYSLVAELHGSKMGSLVFWFFSVCFLGSSRNGYFYLQRLACKVTRIGVDTGKPVDKIEKKKWMPSIVYSLPLSGIGTGLCL